MTKLLTLAAILVAIATPALADTCTHTTTETVIVLGSVVEKQSDVVVVGDCEASIAELTADYIAADKPQAVIKIKRNKQGQVIKNGDY